VSITLLCIGDVVGRAGRYVLSQGLPDLIALHQVDCVIANVENAAGGSGLTPQLYEKFTRYGVHLMTLGDHVYRKKDIIPVLERATNIVKPANLPAGAPGRNFAVHTTAAGHSVALLSVLGQLYMNVRADSPFATVDAVLASLPQHIRIIVVDVHAEATSEKVALGWHLDGRASFVFGTHTHIPTADERLLHRGTAYMTDLGMTGPYDSVLGRRKDRVVGTMRSGIPSAFDVAAGEPVLCGAVVRVDPATGRAEYIERVRYACEPPPSAQRALAEDPD
jgi:metallophosphoesterase (TIGR00282 family)